MLRNKLLAIAVAGLAAALAVSRGGGAAPSGVTAITCTNPVSGTSWQVIIDFGRATVDANPARISSAEISWFDRKGGGNWTLDRRSGELTATVASSTGGYFRYARCNLDSSK